MLTPRKRQDALFMAGEDLELVIDETQEVEENERNDIPSQELAHYEGPKP